jgi:hypothetical protein
MAGSIAVRSRKEWKGRLLTFGVIGPGKGIEHVIERYRVFMNGILRWSI